MEAASAVEDAVLSAVEEAVLSYGVLLNVKQWNGGWASDEPALPLTFFYSGGVHPVFLSTLSLYLLESTENTKKICSFCYKTQFS